MGEHGERYEAGSALGIIGWDLFEYAVEDLERAGRFYREKMGLPVAARLQEAPASRRGEDALYLKAGHAGFVLTSPRDPRSRSGRWLARHPEGVAVLSLRVKDLDHARRVLEERGATFSSPLEEETDGAGRPYRSQEITSPLGDVRFRFTQRATEALPPGFGPVEVPAGANPYGLQVIDHVTSNFLTLEPYVSWLRDVLGFEEYWRVKFHTSDVRGGDEGTGLCSIVMWEPASGIKLANNEPQNPNFEASQIYTFVEENAGPGVQHVAFHLPDIVSAVDAMRRKGVDFLETPGSYYDLLPARLDRKRVTNFREDREVLRRLGILVDGEDDRYLLQIFSVEGKMLQGSPRGGPFFYELIQRRGARGFGEGNFRALFDAIEREQALRRGRPGAAAHPWAGT